MQVCLKELTGWCECPPREVVQANASGNSSSLTNTSVLCNASVVDAKGCAAAGLVWREPERRWQLQPDALTEPLRDRRCGVYDCEQDEGYECYIGNVREGKERRLVISVLPSHGVSCRDVPLLCASRGCPMTDER